MGFPQPAYHVGRVAVLGSFGVSSGGVKVGDITASLSPSRVATDVNLA
jgi:hypothetical protein